jgi:hypothetical protein
MTNTVLLSPEKDVQVVDIKLAVLRCERGIEVMTVIS